MFLDENNMIFSPFQHILKVKMGPTDIDGGDPGPIITFLFAPGIAKPLPENYAHHFTIIIIAFSSIFFLLNPDGRPLSLNMRHQEIIVIRLLTPLQEIAEEHSDHL
eukprot:4035653-Heterocapsa_arctica.AAC.1